MLTRKQLQDLLKEEYAILPGPGPILAMGKFPLLTVYDVLVDVVFDPNTQEQRAITLDQIMDKDGLSEADRNDIINGVLSRLPIAEEVSV